MRGSVALGRGDHILAWRALSPDRRHTTEVLPAIRDMLAETGSEPRDVSVVGFSQGPGSFTGLRVAATIARMWQSATGCEVVAVPTLEVIAQNVLSCPDPPGRIAAILDARRGRLFGAVYERVGADALRNTAEAALHDAEPWLQSLEQPCSVVGEGLAEHQDSVIKAGLDPLPESIWLPDARQVLAIGRRLATAGLFCSQQEIVPVYLRPPECEEVYEQRRAEARARRGE